MVGRAEIERRLGYHPATDPLRVAAFELVRTQFTELAVLLDELLPPGRELAEALTNLQTAQQYAIGAIACVETGWEYPLHSREASGARETAIAVESRSGSAVGAYLDAITCPFRTHYVGDPYGSRGRWLECALPDGHAEALHRTSDGSAFE